MKGSEKLYPGTRSQADGCDIRVWSGACEHATYQDLGEKYLCEICTPLTQLNHEVKHEYYSNVSGDYDNLY